MGVAVSFISTFFAEGFLRLARRAVDRGEVVKRSFFLQVGGGGWKGLGLGGRSQGV